MTKTFTTFAFLFFLACNQAESGVEKLQVTKHNSEVSKEEEQSKDEVVVKDEIKKTQLKPDDPVTPATQTIDQKKANNNNQKRMYRGAVSNGMKGDSISFVVSGDGKRLEDLTFKGYWRCSGKLESILAGPEGWFNIIDGKVDDHISEPPDGGSTAWRFQLKTEIKDGKAAGEFRMNINNLGCDTYLLKFEAFGE